MKRRRSIRVRITVWYSTALAAGLLVFGGTLWLSLRYALLSDVDATLADRARKLALFLDREVMEGATGTLPEEIDEYARTLPTGSLVKVRRGRDLIYSSLPAYSFPVGTTGPLTAAWSGRRFRVLTMEGAWRISLAASLDPVEGVLRRLGWLLIGSIPAVAVLAGAGGYWLSRRALRPVDEITAAARWVGIENLSERLAVPETGDELQRLSETWNEMLARLERAVKRLSQFAEDASHELRTPLALIRSTAEIALRRTRAAEAYQDALRSVVSDTERMTALVEDLLALARSDSDSREGSVQEMTLEPMVEEVCRSMQPIAGAKRVRLVRDIAEGAPPILGNEAALRRLILILMDNALKFSPEGGEVRVVLSAGNGDITLGIIDRGPGIPFSEQQHLFERSSVGSHGLGLSLAQGIARRHGTQIRVKSTPGEGAAFFVSFGARSVIPVSGEMLPAGRHRQE